MNKNIFKSNNLIKFDNIVKSYYKIKPFLIKLHLNLMKDYQKNTTQIYFLNEKTSKKHVLSKYVVPSIKLLNKKILIKLYVLVLVIMLKVYLTPVIY